MEKVYVHCTTIDLWEKVEKHAVDRGILWRSHKKTNDKWHVYRQKSVIEIGRSMSYCDTKYYKDTEIISAKEYLNEKGVENMSELKVGDRVEILGICDGKDCIGKEAVVHKLDDSSMPIRVQFDNGSKWWYPKSQLKHITKKSKESTMSLSINNTIRKVFKGATFEQVEKMQHYFGNEIEENFSGELFLTANKKKFEDEVKRRDEEAKKSAEAAKATCK